MAFDVNRLGRTSISFNEGGAQLFTYNSADDMPTTTAPGYFDLVAPTLTVGSYLMIEAGSDTIIVAVSSNEIPVTLSPTFAPTHNIFTAGVEHLLQGTVYEVRFFPLGEVPDTTTKQVVFRSPNDIDFGKPILLKGTYQNPVDYDPGPTVRTGADPLPYEDANTGDRIGLELILTGGDAVFEVTSNFTPPVGTLMFVDIQYRKL